MNKCSECKYWINDVEYSWFYEDIRFDRAPDYKIIQGEPYVRECKHPKLVFYERPTKDGACVVDGSQYHACLLTGPLFGCVNFEKPDGEEIKK